MSGEKIRTYSHYKIYDEYDQLMRIVKTRHEADHLINLYEGWTYKFVKSKKQNLDLPDAPF